MNGPDPTFGIVLECCNRSPHCRHLREDQTSSSPWATDAKQRLRKPIILRDGARKEKLHVGSDADQLFEDICQNIDPANQ